MRRVLALFACCLVSGITVLADRYVAQSGNTPDGIYSNWTTAATSIQAAINVAVAGETVWVGDGTYYSTGGANNASINITKAITLKSQNGRDLAIIDGNYPTRTNRCIYMTSSGATVDGFTLRNGFLNTVGATYNGAGLYMTNGTVLNCMITANSNNNASGGGAYVTGGTLTNCTFSGNSILPIANNGFYGAGIYMTGGVVTNCQIVGNTNRQSYGLGGGAYMFGGVLTRSTISANFGTNTCGGVGVGMSAGVLRDCTISANIGSNYQGGGVYISGVCTVSLCTITGNTNTTGGGVYFASGSSLFTNNTVANNKAYGNAGGILMYTVSTNALVIDCLVSNNTSAGNAAGGISMGGGRVSGCVIVTNRGYYGGIDISGVSTVVEDTRIELNNGTFSSGGMWLGATNTTVRRCVIVANTTPGRGGGVAPYYAGGIVSNCTIAENWAGAADGAGGIHLGAAGWQFVNCSIVSNFGGTGGGAFLNANSELRNCLVWTNKAKSSGGIHVQGNSALLQNCTIVANVSTNANGGGIMSWVSTVTLTNCIVYGNFSKTTSMSNWSNSATNMAYSCTVPLTGINGAGNTNADPKFVDAANGNFQLKKESPCKNTGLQQDWMSTALDLAAKPRVSGDSVDMGAYEVQPRATGALLLFR